MAQGARLGNRRNAGEAAALGRKAQIEEADRFAANILPVIVAIRSTGIIMLAGIAQALNARGVRWAPRGQVACLGGREPAGASEELIPLLDEN